MKDFNNIVNEFMNALNVFMDSDIRNTWIYLDTMHVYIRKSHKTYDYKIVECLDLANIEVFEPGKGIFTKTLDEILKKYDNIYVESILNRRFYEFLINKGFEPHKNDGHNVIMVK